MKRTKRRRWRQEEDGQMQEKNTISRSRTKKRRLGKKRENKNTQQINKTTMCFSFWSSVPIKQDLISQGYRKWMRGRTTTICIIHMDQKRLTLLPKPGILSPPSLLERNKDFLHHRSTTHNISSHILLQSSCLPTICFHTTQTLQH